MSTLSLLWQAEIAWSRAQVFNCIRIALRSTEVLDANTRIVNHINAYSILDVCKDLKDQVFSQAEINKISTCIISAWQSYWEWLSDQDANTLIILLPLCRLWQSFSFYFDPTIIGCNQSNERICLRSYLRCDLCHQDDYAKEEIAYVSEVVTGWKVSHSSDVQLADTFRNYVNN